LTRGLRVSARRPIALGGARPEDLVAAARAAGVEDERVLNALAEVPRADYVPPELASSAYQDVPLPIAHGQVTTQPTLVARMIAGLSLAGDERVLEVGTGLGFQTALLARLSARVWSVERWPDLAAAARANLERGGIENAEVVVGDGTEGLPERAPFDAILVSAAFPKVPEPLAGQLADGGRLVQPLGSGGNEEVVAHRSRAGVLTRVGMLSGARFVRLYGRHGYPPPKWN
jgi:protein-L-isoaspartate(D-aspartate) O-methyltransferase